MHIHVHSDEFTLRHCDNKYFTVIIYAYNTIIVLEGNTGRDRNERSHWLKTVSNGVVFVGP